MMIMSLEGDPTIFAPCERMGKVLDKKEECFPSDIETFTDEEIHKYWSTAYGLARMARQIEGEALS